MLAKLLFAENHTMKYLKNRSPFLSASLIQNGKLYSFCLLLILSVGCQGNRTDTKEIGDSVSRPMYGSITPSDTAKNVQSRNSINNVKNVIVTDSISGRPIIEQTIAYSDLPLTLDENFDETYQKLIVKIKDVEPTTINATISTKINRYNVRINQIKLPDGSFNGPFSRAISYKIPSKGDVWLIIGKNNMASGIDTGKFEVHISTQKNIGN